MLGYFFIIFSSVTIMGLRNMSVFRNADVESAGQREKRNGLKDVCDKKGDDSYQHN